MTDIKAEVERYAAGAIEDVRLLVRLMDNLIGEQEWEQLSEDYGIDPRESDWLDLLDVMALEIYGTAKVGQNQPGMVSITVVTGTGGPHVEFTVDSQDRVTSYAVWGSDSAVEVDALPGLFDALPSFCPLGS